MSLTTPMTIRTLQRKLYTKAKQEPAYRFYALYDKVSREDFLGHAWRLVRANRGSPGVDGVDFEAIERGEGVASFLQDLARDLKEKTYRAQPVRRVLIPKPGGSLSGPRGQVVQERAAGSGRAACIRGAADVQRWPQCTLHDLTLRYYNWRMPFTMETTEPENARQLLGKTGGPLEKSLFAPVCENELNSDERDVAVYLDGEKALAWWHRNVARTQYGILGWKKAKIYPDFIFAVQSEGEAKRITVLETKGDQLDNLDTAYKREVLDFLSGALSVFTQFDGVVFTLSDGY